MATSTDDRPCRDDELYTVAMVLDLEARRPPTLAVGFKGAAEISDLSRSELYEAAAAGELIVRKRGSRALILVEDLLAFLRTLPRGSYKNPGKSDEEAGEAAAEELFGPAAA